jgi:hypothetical protein
MGYAAGTHVAAATRDYRTRAVLRDAANFARGVLIGGIVVIAVWLVLG